MIGFMVGLVVGGALGVFSTVVLGIVVHQRQQEQEPKPSIHGPSTDPEIVWIGQGGDPLKSRRFH